MTIQNVASDFMPVIRRESGTYWAEIPAMPGCFTVADTLAELKTNLVEAMRCWFMTQGDLASARSSRKRSHRSVCV